MKKFLIAAATSNSGKTTLTIGLLRALRNRGYNVQPFKCGPDYIDTMFHEMASGNESVNLDTFMSSPEHVKELFNHYSNQTTDLTTGQTTDQTTGQNTDQAADQTGETISIVEGVMGLFDGYDKDHGSSAEIAQLLDIPVILVVNAKSTAYSVAPLIYGFKHFNENIRIAGVIFNMVASESHYTFLKSACDDAGVPCLGYLPRNERLVIPSRHLGLTITAKEETEQLISLAAEEVEKYLAPSQLPLWGSAPGTQKDSNTAIVQPLSESAPFSQSDFRRTGALPQRGSGEGATTRSIAIARDEAFNFTYRANIDAMRKEGEVVFFSPLRDTTLPHCDYLYLPGGYPELFLEQLVSNSSMRQSIKEYAERGGKIYAECGGFMYLCHDIDGNPMCNVLPLSATMHGAKLHLGYRQMERRIEEESMERRIEKESMEREITEKGNGIRGHEFHYSTIIEPSTLPDGVTILEQQSSAKGKPVSTPIYHYKNVIAGYTHWYWAEKGWKNTFFD